MRARISRYPNNEIRVAVFPERVPKLDSVDGTQPCQISPIANEDSTTAPLLSLPSSSAPGSDPLLDINFKVEREGRKRRVGLSRYGRRRVLRSGSCFSKGEDSVRLLLTGTLPGSTREALKAMAEYSSYFTHRLCAWITYREKGAKWQYVWEYQKRGALHLHLVVELTQENAQYVESEFKNEWNRLLNAVSDKSGVNLFKKTATYAHTEDKTQADTLRCTREPSRYISKYITKKNTKSFGVNRFPPKQWYQISRSLLRELEEGTEVYERSGLSYKQAREFIEEAAHNLDACEYAGSCEFRGRVYSWSGYGYSEHFKIEEWGNGFMERAETVLHVRFVVQRLANIAKRYPQVSCYMRGSGYSDLVNRVRLQTATETEMYWYIERCISACMVAYPNINNKPPVAATLIATHNWFVQKRGYGFLTDNFLVELNKICEELLTG